MPVVIAAIALVVLLAFLVLSLPLSIIQRYRSGTVRRVGRGWVAAINFFGVAISTLLLLITSAITTAWVPRAFPYTVMGLAGGCVLGLLGLALSRWEATSNSLHFTPNRFLILSITLVVTARLFYGFWRGWQMWGSTPDHTSWLAAAGAAGSMGAGAVVLGYYLTYWAGVRRRLKKHARSAGLR